MGKFKGCRGMDALQHGSLGSDLYRMEKYLSNTVVENI